MKFSKEEIRSAMLLYAVTDRMWLKEGESLADVCKEALDHGITCLQVREKELDEAAFEEEARELKELCGRYHVPCLINDSVEIALAVDADGVHVGQSDIKGRDIRAMIGPDKILGMTARTVEEAREAQAAGADYIGAGAVFGTSTKKNARKMSMEQLQEITSSVSIPVVAIGGINEGNLAELAGSGAAGAAVVSAVFGAEAPGEAVSRLLQLAGKAVSHE